ncbi:MAG: Ig-like domain repeat protein, partial [Chloroflexi bacterium]|nr:Ig-like domain repeat protein [Chloroflexota bacterium]
TYGDLNPTLTATVVGQVVGGDAINYTLATTATQFSNVVLGGYPITVMLGSNPNYSVTKTDGTLTINAAVATVTANNKSKTYGDDNPPLTATVVGQVVGGDAINYSLATTAVKYSDVGGYPITVTLGLNPNYSVTKTDGTLTVTPAPTTTTVNTPVPSVVQYSDMVTLSATVSASVGTTLGGTVEFEIGGVTYGTPALPGGGSASQTVSITVAVTEAPGLYAVTAFFTPSNGNYTGSNGVYNSLKVQPENATPISDGGAYTGQVSAWTPTATSNTATLTLAATIKDISVDGDGDPWPGDITKAKVTFALRNLIGGLTPITGATNLPVGLVNAAVKGIGTAAATVQFSLNSSEICGNYTVVVMVSGNYNMPTPTWQDMQLSICRATPGSIVSNPPAQVNEIGSAGFIAGGSTVQFDVKYNKSGTNPQGKVKVTVTSNLNALTGLPDGKTHTYVITSNAISSLSVKAPNANFAAKANVIELVTNPDGSVTAVSLDSGAIIQLALTDATTDMVGVTVNKSKGGLWFSSKWDGTKTVEKAILNNGAIRITQ